SLDVDGDQAVTEQIVARTMTAVEIRSGIFDRQIGDPRIFVDRDLRPHAGVAVHGPRIVLPGVVAELTRPGNRVEGPEQLARADIESTHEPLRVVVRFDGEPLAE